MPEKESKFRTKLNQFHTLRHLLKWDFQLLLRYKLVLVYLIIIAIYIAMFLFVPGLNNYQVLAIFIYSDPALIGLIFSGGLVFYERNENVLQAILMTPLKTSQYIWSKILNLTFIAFYSSIALVLIVFRDPVNYFWLSCGVILSSILFTLMGFILISLSQNIMRFLYYTIAFDVIMMIPFLNFIGITDTWLMYLIPSQASILLMTHAFMPGSAGDLIYSLVILIVGIICSSFIAVKVFNRLAYKKGDLTIE